MKLIIGGAYQGKVKYAKETYGVRDGWISGGECTISEIGTCRGICQFHELVKRMLFADVRAIGSEEVNAGANTEKTILREESSIDHVKDEGNAALTVFDMGDLSKLEQQAEVFAEALYEKNPDIVIVSNELGYGIVPMEKKDRMWREAVGRICTALAARSDEVVRVVCGVGMRLK